MKINGLTLFKTFLLYILISSILVSCGSKKISDVDKFKDYISAYSGNIISKNGVIVIKFTDLFASTITNQSTSFIKLNPKVSGTITWKSNDLVEFKPDKPLLSNTTYLVSVNMSQLKSSMYPGSDDFIFKVQTRHQHVDARITKVETTNLQNFSKQNISGLIKLNDSEDIELIKSCISCKLDNNAVDFELEQLGDLEYSFLVKDISRNDNNQIFSFTFDGNAINFKEQVYLNLEVPKLKDFKLLSIQSYQFPDQHIDLIFSDPIKTEQLLEGLISLKDNDGKNIRLRYLIIDNIIKIIPLTNLSNNYNLEVSSIRNIFNKSIPSYSELISFTPLLPQLSRNTQEVIIPSTPDGQVISFDAVNIKAVDIRITKIYENNILQFLQTNDLNESMGLRNVGSVIVTKTIDLEQTTVRDFSQWNTFYLNLNDIIKTEQGAIYHIDLCFRKENCIIPCANESQSSIQDKLLKTDNDWSWFTDYTYYNYDTNVYDYDEYSDDYYSSDDPCKTNYYGFKRSLSFNILGTDIGIIAKYGTDNIITAFATNLVNSEPMNNVKLELYNFQNQLVVSSTSDGDGKAELVIPEDTEDAKPYVLIASKSKQRTYLKLNPYQSLSTSEFDVLGSNYSDDELGAFIYSERGVWRPGDSIFLSLILNENNKSLPVGHPILLEVTNPNNQEVYREIQRYNEKGFHVFKFKTNLNDITGNYIARFSVGSNIYTKSLMIETIRPNRLNVDLKIDKPYLSGDGSVTAFLTARWLHGAPASDLDAQVNITLNETSNSSLFDKFSDYTFTNSYSNFNFTTTNLFSGKTDENGMLETAVKIDKRNNFPGVLEAVLTSKVFEKGGNFSIGENSFIYYPYSNYVGIKLVEASEYSYALPVDKDLNLDIVVIDRLQKNANSNVPLELSIYSIESSWWYDYQSSGVDFISSNYNNALLRDKLTAVNGKAHYAFNFGGDGSYLIVVKDLQGGHISSKYVYASSTAYKSSNNTTRTDLLNFTTDKPKYSVGEKVKVSIPAITGRALVSIENNEKVLSSFWVKSNDNTIEFDFKVDESMIPNVYLNISFIQEHKNTHNMRPIRMYGIVPVYVENPNSHLEPLIDMPDELTSESKFNIKISEKNGKAMTYTIAIVDEGLLNLTKFITPNPWSYFNQKISLGVRTWDIYNFVSQAFTAEVGRMLSIGGDLESASAEDLNRATRFKPMVRFIGPFSIKKGKSASHEIQLPQYVGSVRTMVIAREESSYGSAEKTSRVTKPLMVLASAPRVIGTHEEFILPINVFTMKPNIKDVKVMVKTNNLLHIDGANSQNVRFSSEGDKYIYFTLNSQSQTGIAKIEVIASSGANISKYDIELDVRHANSKQTDIISGNCSNTSYKTTFKPLGISGSNETYLELYSLPPLNLEKRLDYLISYPHGCLEQIVSAAFPQLYIESLIDLSQDDKAKIQNNINRCISRLSLYQISSGGFAFWPGSNTSSEWVSNYVGHFLLEAEKMGYTISPTLKNKFISYQKEKASKWLQDSYISDLTQAYRLYTLALSGNADKGAMNRLKESKLSTSASWRLAAAYALCGKDNIALEMIKKLNTKISFNRTYFYETFGTEIRDKAMILETLTELGQKDKAFSVLKEISDFIGSNVYANTQTTAYSLLAASKFVKKFKVSETIDCQYILNNKTYTAKTDKSVFRVLLPVNDTVDNTLQVQSLNKGLTYIRIIRKGIPNIGEEKEGSSNLSMTVNYTDLEGKSIDVKELTQGTDFVATIKIQNKSYNTKLSNIALTQVFPSGWEIINSRMFTSNLGDDSYFSYQDIRDDRVYTYFDINSTDIYTYRILLNASFAGKFYLPAVLCETMYDDSNYARNKGMWITIK